MDTRKMVRLSLLVAVATVLSILENQLPIPRPFPWLKLGLANITTLVALMMYDTRAAMTVACIRALLVGIFFAPLPMLIFSFPAAVTSSLSMGALHRMSGRRLSVIGLSISGAVVHNLTQLLIARFVLSLNRSSILAITPLLIFAAVTAGLVTGLITRRVVSRIVPE